MSFFPYCMLILGVDYWTFLFHSIQCCKLYFGAPRKHFWGECWMTDHVDTVFPGFLESLRSPWARPRSEGCRIFLPAPEALVESTDPPGLRLLGRAELSAGEPEGWGSAGQCQPTGALPSGPKPWLQRDVAVCVRWGGTGLKGQEFIQWGDGPDLSVGTQGRGKCVTGGANSRLGVPETGHRPPAAWAPRGWCPTSRALPVSVENVMQPMEERWDGRVSPTA